MKVWTYLEMSTKVQSDLDLQDQTFIQPNEMIGYFNEAIQEAEAEICGTKEEYFLSQYNFPVVAGIGTYTLPPDIYINKIRRIVYTNGPLIYEVKKIKEWRKFTEIALTASFGVNDWYRYYITNTSPGNMQWVQFPVSRETAVLPQQNGATAFTPIQFWYLRTANRIPVVGEFIHYYETYLQQANVSVGANTITLVNKTYVTGDQVQFFAHAWPGGTAGLPAPLVMGTTYFVITTGTPGVVKLATTAANAAAGTALVITTTGVSTGYFNLEIMATTLLINAQLVDIPEFATFVMQWVKCRCFEKEGDPRLGAAVSTLEQQRKQMVDTLTEMIVDNDTTIEIDYTHYQEMS